MTETLIDTPKCNCVKNDKIVYGEEIVDRFPRGIHYKLQTNVLFSPSR